MKINVNFWEYGLIAAEHTAEYTKPKTEQCTKEDAQNVYVPYKFVSAVKVLTEDFLEEVSLK